MLYPAVVVELQLLLLELYQNVCSPWMVDGNRSRVGLHRDSRLLDLWLHEDFIWHTALSLNLDSACYSVFKRLLLLVYVSVKAFFSVMVFVKNEVNCSFEHVRHIENLVIAVFYELVALGLCDRVVEVEHPLQMVKVSIDAVEFVILLQLTVSPILENEDHFSLRRVNLSDHTKLLKI